MPSPDNSPADPSGAPEAPIPRKLAQGLDRLESDAKDLADLTARIRAVYTTLETRLAEIPRTARAHAIEHPSEKLKLEWTDRDHDRLTFFIHRVTSAGPERIVWSDARTADLAKCLGLVAGIVGAMQEQFTERLLVLRDAESQLAALEDLAEPPSRADAA